MNHIKRNHPDKIKKVNKYRNKKRGSGPSLGLKDFLLIGRAAYKAFWEIFIPYLKDLMIRGTSKEKAKPIEIYFLVAVLASLEIAVLKTFQFIGNLLARF